MYQGASSGVGTHLANLMYHGPSSSGALAALTARTLSGEDLVTRGRTGKHLANSVYQGASSGVGKHLANPMYYGPSSSAGWVTAPDSVRSNAADYDTVWTTVVDHVEAPASHARERPVSYAGAIEALSSDPAAEQAEAAGTGRFNGTFGAAVGIEASPHGHPTYLDVQAQPGYSLAAGDTRSVPPLEAWGTVQPHTDFPLHPAMPMYGLASLDPYDECDIPSAAPGTWGANPDPAYDELQPAPGTELADDEYIDTPSSATIGDGTAGDHQYEEVQSVAAANPTYDEIADGYIWVAGEDPELGSDAKRRSGVFASGGDLGPDQIRANMCSLRTVDLVRAREAAKVAEPGLSQTFGEASWAPVAEARAKWKKSQISRDEYDHVVRAHTAVATDGQDAASPFLPIGLTDVMVRDMTPKALVARMELEKWTPEEVDEGKAFRLRLRAHRNRSSYKDRLYENLTRVEPRRDEDFVLPSERVDGNNIEGTGSLSVADIVADSNRTSTFTDMMVVKRMARQAAENEARRQVAIKMAEKEYVEASEELKAANLATGHGTTNKEKRKKKAKYAMHVATNRLDELGMSKKAQAALSTKAMAKPVEVAAVEEEFELFVRDPKFKKKPKAKDGRTESTIGFAE